MSDDKVTLNLAFSSALSLAFSVAFSLAISLARGSAFSLAFSLVPDDLVSLLGFRWANSCVVSWYFSQLPSLDKHCRVGNHNIVLVDMPDVPHNGGECL